MKLFKVHKADSLEPFFFPIGPKISHLQALWLLFETTVLYNSLGQKQQDSRREIIISAKMKWKREKKTSTQNVTWKESS